MSDLHPLDYLYAAKVRPTLAPQAFGLWEIVRTTHLAPLDRALIGGNTMTSLHHWTEATLHLNHGEVVMEDSNRELRKHLPIWMAARGRVLKTGLGLGCVVRGLLIKPEVEHIDVVEIDADIIRVVGAEFSDEPRVTIHHADAETFNLAGRSWDLAWHDVWLPGNQGLPALHARLMARYWPATGRQGAWDFPRTAARALPLRLLGAPKTPRQRAA